MGDIDTGYQAAYDADELLQRLIEAREATEGQPQNSGVRHSLTAAIEERKQQLRK